MFWSFLIVALLPPNPWILDHEFFPIIWESGKDGIFEPFFWWGWLSRYVPKMLKSHICETLHQIAKTKPRYLPWISRFQAKNMTDFSTPNLVEVLFFFADFGRGKDVMVCTNLASRGLDFSNAPRLLKVGNWWFRFVVEVGDVKRYPKKNRDHEILKWDPFFGGRNQTWFLKLVTVNFWRDFDFSSEQGA